MCRLFGLIANKEVDVKFSMLEASNRFKKQGDYNPHGWGIGWYEGSKPQVEKHGENAFESKRFDELSKEVQSRIVIAHVRLASSGKKNTNENAHPFAYKNWLFAHNGTVNKNRIFLLLKEPYGGNFSSEPIDSEVYFRYLIQCIEEENDVETGVKKAVREVTKDGNGANFLLSNGVNIYAFKYGNTLRYLERDPEIFYPCFSEETSALIEAKRLASEKAVLIATEKLTRTEDWKELSDGEILIVDNQLAIKKETVLG